MPCVDQRRGSLKEHVSRTAAELLRGFLFPKGRVQLRFGLDELIVTQRGDPAGVHVVRNDHACSFSCGMTNQKTSDCMDEPCGSSMGSRARVGGVLASRPSTGALRRLGLDLPCFARLDVMPTPAQLAQDAGFLHLTLERLQRPVDSV